MSSKTSIPVQLLRLTSTIEVVNLRRITSSTIQAAAGEGQGWMPSWMRSRLPQALGGTRDEINELENLTLDAYAKSIRQARRLGGLTGFVHGTSAVSDPAAQGTLRMFENIIEAMKPEERADVSSFGSVARERVAAETKCTLQQVDDCIARYLWTSSMSRKMAELRREGKDMPKSIDDLERVVGTWQQFKTQRGVTVNEMHVGKGGVPCPLAGMQPGRNTKCMLTKKAYKSCCGRKINN